MGIAAIVSAEDVPIPPAVELPSFSPHANPLEPYGEKMALWGAGEFLKAEVRREHLVPDCVDDLTDGALPSVLKPYVGVDVGHEQPGDWDADRRAEGGLRHGEHDVRCEAQGHRQGGAGRADVEYAGIRCRG